MTPPPTPPPDAKPYEVTRCEGCVCLTITNLFGKTVRYRFWPEDAAAIRDAITDILNTKETP